MERREERGQKRGESLEWLEFFIEITLLSRPPLVSRKTGEIVRDKIHRLGKEKAGIREGGRRTRFAHARFEIGRQRLRNKSNEERTREEMRARRSRKWRVWRGK